MLNMFIRGTKHEEASPLEFYLEQDSHGVHVKCGDWYMITFKTSGKVVAHCDIPNSLGFEVFDDHGSAGLLYEGQLRVRTYRER